MYNQERNNQLILKLCRLAQKWGGNIVYLDYKAFEANLKMAAAPFTNSLLGINFQEKTIYYSNPDFYEHKVLWHEIVHEMGHVFATKNDVLDGAVKEFNFFGWEYVLAKHIRAPVTEWKKSNNNYSVDSDPSNYIEFGELDSKEQREILNERIEQGIKLGIILRKDKKLIPLPIR